jgi:hypothetical protein
VLVKEELARDYCVRESGMTLLARRSRLDLRGREDAVEDIRTWMLNAQGRYQVTWITSAGQASDASITQFSRSSGASPSPNPPVLYFSATWLKLSSGFSSKKSGQSSQHVPQLMQPSRSMTTFVIAFSVLRIL